MTLFGFFVGIVILFSLFIGYKIYLKISDKGNHVDKQRRFLGKLFLILFISGLMISINMMAFVFSYSFFWEKAFRTLNEQKFEATVVGYQKEIVKSKNFSTSSYDNKTVFFPKVEYTNNDGRKVIKNLDVTSNNPPKIGKKLKITDSIGENNINTVELNWVMFSFGCLFSGISCFFATLLSTCVINYTMKMRVLLSIGLGILLAFVNLSCILVIYCKTN